MLLGSLKAVIRPVGIKLGKSIGMELQQHEKEDCSVNGKGHGQNLNYNSGQISVNYCNICKPHPFLPPSHHLIMHRFLSKDF